jgi:hypothetical protein
MKKIHYYLHKIQVLTCSYLGENWGFPFIAGFLLFLFSSALLLEVSIINLAKQIAGFAYFSLVLSVILQLICLSKNRRKNGEVFDGSS